MLTLSLALIIKNELKTIEKTLASALPYVDEVVIGLDEASSDGTEELLQKYPQYKVIRTTLTKDLADKTGGFAKARNQTIAATTGDWVLMLDGHELLEILPDHTLKQVIADAEKQGSDAVYAKVWSEVQNGVPALILDQIRLFKRHIRYERENHSVPNAKNTFTTKDYKVLHLRKEQDPTACRERRKQADNTNEIGLKKALAKDPFDRRSIFYLGNTYRDRKEWANAIAQYERYIALGSNFKEELYYAYYYAATCYQALHQNDQAIVRAQQATELMPQMAEAFYLLGEIYYYQQQNEQAMFWLEKCCELDIPDVRMFVYPPIYMIKRYDILSMVYHRLGMIDKARETILKALKNDPNNERFLRNLSWWSGTPVVTAAAVPSTQEGNPDVSKGNTAVDYSKYKIHIVATGWNCAWNIDTLVASIKQQPGNWTLHLLDDGSDDDTAERLRVYEGGNIRCYYEKENLGAALRRYQVIHPLEPTSVIVLVGLDDALLPGALESILREYDQGMWHTYSNWKNQHGKIFPESLLDLPNELHQTRDYRRQKNKQGTGCQSFYKWLFDKIPEEDFKVDGQWEKTATDVELMSSMLEMCGKEHTGVVRQPTHLYNQSLPHNSQKRFGQEYKNKIRDQIAARPKRDPVFTNPYGAHTNTSGILILDQPAFSLAPHLTDAPDVYITQNTASMRRDSISTLSRYKTIFLDFCDDRAVSTIKRIAILAGKKPRVVVRVHAYEVHSRLVTRVPWREVDTIIFVSEYYKNLFTNIVGPLETTKTLVIPNVINLKRFHISDIPQNPKNVAVLSSISPKKGATLLGLIAASFPDYSFEVGGQFQDERARLYLENLNLPNLHFHGQVDSAEFLKGKKFLLSTSCLESFGMAIAEAMASGVTPLILKFPGVENLWDPKTVYTSIQDLSKLLQGAASGEDIYNPQYLREWVMNKYPFDRTVSALRTIILGEPNETR